jgi:hypothetical protein
MSESAHGPVPTKSVAVGTQTITFSNLQKIVAVSRGGSESITKFVEISCVVVVATFFVAKENVPIVSLVVVFFTVMKVEESLSDVVATVVPTI